MWGWFVVWGCVRVSRDLRRGSVAGREQFFSPTVCSAMINEQVLMHDSDGLAAWGGQGRAASGEVDQEAFALWRSCEILCCSFSGSNCMSG